MIVEVYESCSENELYSENGINIIITRCIPDDEVSLKFEDDGGKVLFNANMEWSNLKQMIIRLEDEIISK
jgi:hypothetical protein